MNPMNPTMTRVAFLGLGAMGSRMARRLVDGGVPLTTWSRTRGPMNGLEPASAERTSRERSPHTIRDAVADAEVVLSMVRDDAASRAIWMGPDGALGQLRPGTTLIECSTLSPGWVQELAGAAAAAGVSFLEAPVVGTRPQAAAGALAFLAGGSPEVLHHVRPLLDLMGSAVHHLGAPPAGAHAKLIVNMLFAIQVAALGELFGLAARAGQDARMLLDVLSTLPVLSGAAKGAAEGILAKAFAPLYPIELVAKDLAYGVTAATQAGAPLPIAERARRVFDAGVAQGLGGDNVTAIATLYL